jgi:hypothetical protein
MLPWNLQLASRVPVNGFPVVPLSGGQLKILVDSVVETIQYVHSEVAGHRGVKATVDKLLRAGYSRSNLQQEQGVLQEVE